MTGWLLALQDIMYVKHLEECVACSVYTTRFIHVVINSKSIFYNELIG